MSSCGHIGGGRMKYHFPLGNEDHFRVECMILSARDLGALTLTKHIDRHGVESFDIEVDAEHCERFELLLGLNNVFHRKVA